MLHAVFVGINEYQDPTIRSLRYAKRDAEAFAALIEGRIEPSERQVKILIDRDATRKNVMDHIGESLPRLVEPDDVVLIHFACHGSPETSGSPDDVSRYLVMHDTEYERIYSTGVDMSVDVHRWFTRLHKARVVVLFLDTCFSGAAGEGARTFEGPLFARCGLRSGLVSMKNLDLGRGQIVITAAGHDQRAQEDESLQHGIFTHHLLQILGDPAEGSPTVDLAQLYARVRRSVKDATVGRQLPIISGTLDGASLPRLP